MNLNTITNDRYSTPLSYAAEAAGNPKGGDFASQMPANACDRLELSAEGLKRQENGQDIYATSGTDSLKITKSRNSNTYVIHFTNSAQVSRIIQQGYLTVNGIRIDLTDDVKDQLKKTDKQTCADRENALALFMAMQNAQAAREQGESYKEAAIYEAKMMEIARRIARGGKVPSSDEKKLIEYNPEMYQMAKMSSILAKKHKKYKSMFDEEEEQGAKEEQENSLDTEVQKSYETQMTISMEGTPAITEISEAAV